MSDFAVDNEGYKGFWRTVGGKRIFIRIGETLSEAMIRSGKFKTDKDSNEESDKKAKERNSKVKNDDFKTIKLSKKEYSLVVSEINTNLPNSDKVAGKYLSKHIGDSTYYFVYNDFNDYTFLKKVRIK